jgi:ribosomal protein S18 acetylase RimI-like enzyme
VSVCLLDQIRIDEATTPDDLDQVQRLFRAYLDWLEIDLGFQDIETELATLPGRYAPPPGRLLLARVGAEAIGTVGLRPLSPGIAEMKRLWVEPGFAGQGLGRRLAERIIEIARIEGYRAMRLDTLGPKMPAALRLYRSLGFKEIPPYYHNPVAGMIMLELDLSR